MIANNLSRRNSALANPSRVCRPTPNLGHRANVKVR